MTIDVDALDLLPAAEPEISTDDVLGLAPCSKTCDFTCTGKTCKITQQ